jgi:hypothetical protein
VLGPEPNVDKLRVILIEMRMVAVVKAELEFLFLFNMWCYQSGHLLLGLRAHNFSRWAT